ncbi:hypothetical protein F4703DRAFT_1794349 [Phycomyces blakesleeanus]
MSYNRRRSYLKIIIKTKKINVRVPIISITSINSDIHLFTDYIIRSKWLRKMLKNIKVNIYIVVEDHNTSQFSFMNQSMQILHYILHDMLSKVLQKIFTNILNVIS